MFKFLFSLFSTIYDVPRVKFSIIFDMPKLCRLHKTNQKLKTRKYKITWINYVEIFYLTPKKKTLNN